MGHAVHVVCHECPEEGVYPDHESATEVLETHEAETGHRIELLGLDAAATGP